MGGRWRSCHSAPAPFVPTGQQGGYTVIRAGDTLVNAVSGETIIFVHTAAETGGDYTLIECLVEPGGGVPMAHVHPYQSETFEILEGELSMKTGRDTRVAQAGDVVTIEPGRVHKFWNAGDRIARSGAPSRRHSSSSGSSRRCSRAPPTASCRSEGCRTRSASRRSRTATSPTPVRRTFPHGCRRQGSRPWPRSAGWSATGRRTPRRFRLGHSSLQPRNGHRPRRQPRRQ